MGKLHYYDGSIAVCGFEQNESKTAQTQEETVRLLLSYAADPSEKTLLKLLACAGIPWPTLGVDVVPNIRTNRDALEQLGVRVTEKRGLREGSYALEFSDDFKATSICFCVDVTKTRIDYLSADMALLSKLFLLANGDARHEGALQDVVVDEEKGVSVSVALPSATGGTVKREFAFRFGEVGCQGVEGSGFVHIDLDAVSTSDVSYSYESESVTLSEFPNSIAEQKRLLAGYVLARLLNQRNGARYGWSAFVGLTDSQSSSYSAALASAMCNGKIKSCPWCGCPVLLPRKSSKPFCRPSHQTRYNEKAHAMLNNGADVDEVSEAFPHINYATIRNWL